MTLLALLLAFAIERAVTHLLHLREPRWFDGYLDWVLARFRGLKAGGASAIPIAVTAGLVLLPVLPVAIVAGVFHEVLLGVLYVAFAAFVLIFSLGPRDLKTEVDDYLAALERGDRDSAARIARAIMEHDAAQRTGAAPESLQDAIFVQTNNRVFAVAFWFMLLGPAGAWAFRVSDLLRRRAVFEYYGRAGYPAAAAQAVPEFVHALQVVHGALAWAPARLLALGYALAGSFEQALGEWRRHMREAGAQFFETNDHLLARVGAGALGADAPPVEVLPLHDAGRVRECMRLITRALVIWLAFIAALVLVGWVR